MEPLAINSDLPTRIYQYQEGGSYPKSLFYRPLPHGKRVYLVLFQLLLLAIVRSVSEAFFDGIVFKYGGGYSTHGILNFISFTTFAFLFSLPMGFIADHYSGRATTVGCFCLYLKCYIFF